MMSVFIGGFTGQAHLKNIKIFSTNRFHNFLNTVSLLPKGCLLPFKRQIEKVKIKGFALTPFISLSSGS